MYGRAPYHEYTVRPPVRGDVMSLPVDNLRGHVLDSTAEGERLLVLVYRLLTESKVCEFYMSVHVQQNTEKRREGDMHQCENERSM